MITISGERIVQRSPADLWQLLMDPAVLRRCIPGCEAFELLEPGRYEIAIKVSLGLIRGSFRGEATLKDVVELERYRLEMNAKGKTGYVQGSTDVRLVLLDGSQETKLVYQSDAKVGGVLASVGARLFQGAARSLADQFFDELSRP
jgi:carbon monoxide dehydrogenase subunit G